MNSNPEASAQVFDQGYRPWRGELQPSFMRSWVIAVEEMRLAWKEKRFRQLAYVSFFPLGVFGLMLVAKRYLGFNLWPKFWSVQCFISVLVVFFVGRRAIGEDLRTGALILYFSRPVSFVQYILGKWLGIFLSAMAVTLVPGVVLAFFAWLIDPQIDAAGFLSTLGWLLLLGISLCLTQAAVMLALSALLERGRAAGIVWVLMFFLLSALGNGLAEATGIDSLRSVSFMEANVRWAHVFLGTSAWQEEHLWGLLSQALWAICALSVVLLKLRSWRRS